MTTDPLTLAVQDDIATLTLNHPPANLLSRHVLQDLSRAFEFAASHTEVKAIILTATGRFFSAGADLNELQNLQNVQHAKETSIRGQAIFTNIERIEKPVIAAVNGICVGGGLELAMACHMRIAGKNASFGLPEVNLGLIPGYGGTQRLTRLVGEAKATQLILTGSTITADEAVALGLLNEVCPDNELMPRAQDLSRVFLTKSRPAIRAALRAIRAFRDSSQEEGFAQETRWFSELFNNLDRKEGIQAFLEKRAPRFSDP